MQPGLLRGSCRSRTFQKANHSPGDSTPPAGHGRDAGTQGSRCGKHRLGQAGGVGSAGWRRKRTARTLTPQPPRSIRPLTQKQPFLHAPESARTTTQACCAPCRNATEPPPSAARSSGGRGSALRGLQPPSPSPRGPGTSAAQEPHAPRVTHRALVRCTEGPSKWLSRMV